MCTLIGMLSIGIGVGLNIYILSVLTIHAHLFFNVFPIELPFFKIMSGMHCRLFVGRHLLR